MNNKEFREELWNYIQNTFNPNMIVWVEKGQNRKYHIYVPKEMLSDIKTLAQGKVYVKYQVDDKFFKDKGILLFKITVSSDPKHIGISEIEVPYEGEIYVEGQFEKYGTDIKLRCIPIPEAGAFKESKTARICYYEGGEVVKIKICREGKCDIKSIIENGKINEKEFKEIELIGNTLEVKPKEGMRIEPLLVVSKIDIGNKNRTHIFTEECLPENIKNIAETIASSTKQEVFVFSSNVWECLKLSKIANPSTCGNAEYHIFVDGKEITVCDLGMWKYLDSILDTSNEWYIKTLGIGFWTGYRAWEAKRYRDVIKYVEELASNYQNIPELQEIESILEDVAKNPYKLLEEYEKKSGSELKILAKNKFGKEYSKLNIEEKIKLVREISFKEIENKIEEISDSIDESDLSKLEEKIKLFKQLCEKQPRLDITLRLREALRLGPKEERISLLREVKSKIIGRAGTVVLGVAFIPWIVDIGKAALNKDLVVYNIHLTSEK